MTQLKQVVKVSRDLSHQYGIVNSPDIGVLKYSRTGKKVSLGFYNYLQNIIEINKHCLELWDIQQLTELLQHELMHTLCYQKYNGYDGAHDKRFRTACRDAGIPFDIARATKR
jgi:predicted SprT family Zn-dependent metalloprotease